MTIKVIRDCIAIIRESDEEVLSSGIIIPNIQGVNDSVFVGKVVAVGDGILLNNAQRVPLDVKVGDRGSFDIKQAKVIRYGRETLYVLRESGVVCIFPAAQTWGIPDVASDNVVRFLPHKIEE